MDMTMNSGGAAEAPIMNINTTPLIDVLLVLLIMFILTIPIQTHALKLDSPGGPPPREAYQPTRNEIGIANDDRVTWNGAQVDLITLRQYLNQSQTLDPIPELQIHPASKARYERVDQVLAIAKRAHVAKMGFVGNEAYARDF